VAADQLSAQDRKKESQKRQRLAQRLVALNSEAIPILYEQAQRLLSGDIYRRLKSVALNREERSLVNGAVRRVSATQLSPLAPRFHRRLAGS
jgi:hypothetical protein